jgi:hypothetical protein
MEIILLPTVQKEQRVRLVSLMQRESILFMTDAVSSFLEDFYVLSTFASLEYAFSNIPAYSPYSSVANVENV